MVYQYLVYQKLIYQIWFNKCRGFLIQKGFAIMDYTKTPSFYNNEDVFKKFLSETSYYKALQNNVSKLISIIKPNNMLELGFGTGDTALRLAKENPDALIKAVDLRKEMTNIAIENAKKQGLNNVSFITDNMVDYVQHNQLPEVTIMLYSFHHIEDPISKKINFLKTCKNNMPKKGFLCIAEAFLQENSSVPAQWEKRALEANASTFWNTLSDIDLNSIDFSNNVATYSMDHETKAGELVEKRQDEYLVARPVLCETLKELNFTLIINQDCNSLGEGIVLAKLE